MLAITSAATDIICTGPSSAIVTTTISTTIVTVYSLTTTMVNATSIISTCAYTANIP